MELNNTIQIECWRQRLTKEEKQSKNKNDAEIKRLEDLLNKKNSYFNAYKKDETVKEEEENEMKATNFAYDMAGVNTAENVMDKNAPKFSKYKHDSRANPDTKPRKDGK